MFVSVMEARWVEALAAEQVGKIASSWGFLGSKVEKQESQIPKNIANIYWVYSMSQTNYCKPYMCIVSVVSNNSVRSVFY